MNGSTDKPNQYSAEQLNAFVDDQLASEDKSRLLIDLSGSEALSREVCELRKVRDLVRLAYPEPGTARRAGRDCVGRGGFGFPAVAAALATLTLGVILGWFMHAPSPELAANAPTIAQDQARSLVQPASSTTTPGSASASRIIMHVTEGDPKQLAQALDDLEGMLRLYKARHLTVRVELVANGDGLALLRRDTSRYAERIARLQKQYDNLSFVACQNTIDRLKKETGVTARLLPGVIVIDSGVAQLMRRQNQGWAYIQV